MIKISRLNCAPSRDAGFSIIEMLICLVLMGTLLTFVVAAAGNWIRLQDRGKEEIAAIESLSLGIEALHADVQRSRLVRVPGATNNVSIRGNTEELTLFAVNAGNQIAIHYHHGKSGGLDRQEKIMSDTIESRLPYNSTLLSSNFYVRFQYIDQNGTASNEWNAQVYPKAIRVSFHWLLQGQERSDLAVLRFPEYLPTVCTQASTYSRCIQLNERGSEVNSSQGGTFRTSRSRRGR